MEYTMRMKKNRRTEVILELFSHLAPFSSLSKREKEVFSEYIDGYFELKDKDNTIEQISAVLFDYNFTLKVSEKIGISMDSVRNYATKLRHKGLLDGHVISQNVLTLFNTIKDQVTFKLEIVD